ncbi:DEP domain-containing mTOR-interacting protein [Oryx dammah]|uniref:DEP domain-containing mTOR-interacting protein n=1 Tax=Oryx dammah TaxID=59534 RepID=UPI001A9C1BFD|nr:DEP domain-containing mTOR-interacting protein [Oryx dammah]
MGESERTFRSARWMVPGRGGSARGAAEDQGRPGREPPRSEPGPSSLLGFPHWLPAGLRLEGRLPGQTGLETIGPVPVLDRAVLLGLADGCPLSGEKPVALVPSPSSQWAQGPPKSGTLSQAPPRTGKASWGALHAARGGRGAGGVLQLQGLLRLHEEKVIKDRRHHLKTYPNCFVAKELIDWLIEHKEASDRETAVKLMQKLADRGIIHHVCDEHKEFKDVKLFYRFRKDDGTFPLDNEVKAFVRGQRLYEKLMSPENTLLQPREEEGVKYERTFMASEFLDWLVQEGEATAREEAEQLCRRLLERGIIQHVSNKHPFVDSNLLYQFRMNFRRRRRLMELLSEKSPSSQETHDSPFCLRKQGHDNRKSASFTSVSPSKEIKVASATRRSSLSSCGSGGYFSSSPTLSNSPPVLCNPKSVLKRPVTSEELLTPGAPYARKTFTIVGDAVGWGFVVRGSKPCHIQAVDPSGPAAAAGMKCGAHRWL